MRAYYPSIATWLCSLVAFLLPFNMGVSIVLVVWGIAFFALGNVK